MSEKSSPFVHAVDLARLPEGETEIALAPKAAEREALADWAGVDAVDALAGTVRLKKLGAGHFHYDARFTADVTQSCVVTLEPVHSHIERAFKRLYQVESMRNAPIGKRAIELSATVDDDEPEILDSSKFDIAGPVLEELSLAIDPYPRAPGAAFQPPKEKDAARESPFAVLKGLKTKS